MMFPTFSPVVLILLLGLQNCQSLKCFTCIYTTTYNEGKLIEAEGDPECDDIESARSARRFLGECDVSLPQCGVLVTTKEIQGVYKFRVQRACTKGFELGRTTTQSLGADVVYDVCEEDECNYGQPLSRPTTTNDGHGNSAHRLTLPPTLLLILLLASCLTLPHM